MPPLIYRTESTQHDSRFVLLLLQGEMGPSKGESPRGAALWNEVAAEHHLATA